MRDKARVQHILEAIKDIEVCMQDINSYEEYQSDRILCLATVKLIEIIGEASNHISDELKAQYPDIDWQAIVGMRNILVHEYFDISYEIMWENIIQMIPPFKQQMQQILKNLEML